MKRKPEEKEFSNIFFIFLFFVLEEKEFSNDIDVSALSRMGGLLRQIMEISIHIHTHIFNIGGLVFYQKNSVGGLVEFETCALLH